jgi:acyl-CoA thioesterase
MEISEELKEKILAFLNASPFYQYLGMEVLDAGDGICRLHLPIKGDLKNLFGMVHGGVISTLLDTACSIAAGTLMGEDEMAVTIDQTVNYVSNTSEGTLYAEGKAVHRGRNTAVAQAEVRDDRGNLVAYGTATIFVSRRS